MDSAYLQSRITATKAQIAAYEDAAAAFGTDGAIQSYTVDTGQSRTTVTRADLQSINDIIDGLYNRLATLEARLNGSGTLIGRPGW